MNTKQLFSTIYAAAKDNRVLVSEAKSCWGEHRYETKLANGVVVITALGDEGYSNAIRVPGLLNVVQTMDDEPKFYLGDEKALLTVARLMGLDN